LQTRYGEVWMWAGLVDNGVNLVLTANPVGTSWTALALMQDGKVCPIASGATWTATGPATLPGVPG